MEVLLENISKKFHNNTIFKDLSFTFKMNNSYAILGPNGSGKSTLIQIISGFVSPDEGQRKVLKNGSLLDELQSHNLFISAAPYMDLYSSMTLKKFLEFHFTLRPYEISIESFLEKINLIKHTNKELVNFSSGMLQKLKLGLCFFSESPVILLDEPTMNLDQNNFNWYHQNIETILKKKMIIIASNDPKETELCDTKLMIEDFKPNV